MIQVQDIYNSFDRYKRDIDDVDDVSNLFLEWVQFTTRFVWDKVKRVDPERFVKTQSYNVVKPPQYFSLPSDYEDMNVTSCGLYKYNMRKKLMVGFNASSDSDITYTDSGGTSAYNTDIYVEGGSSRGYTGDAAATMQLTFGTALDFTDFGDGGADSPTNDKISIWVYIGNSVPTSVTLGLYSTSAKTNGATYQETTLVEGWNRIVANKSSYTAVGTTDWSSIGYMEFTHAGGAASTNIYYDKLDLVENEVNGNDQTNEKIALTGYGNTNEGYYLRSSYIEFTGADTITDKYYVMRYLPYAPTIDALTDYITVDGTSSTAQIVEDRHLEYMVKAVDVLYEQWDNDPGAESIADFRFVRALGGLLDGYNRQPQVYSMENPNQYF